ncbi:MAG: glycosyltransferase [Chloroflexi bacterium]|nr:glycosyltransferase [Chloroflexota bacterium]
MPTFVNPKPKQLDDYREVIGEEAYQEIVELAKPLAGKRVLHLNATASGGGVAELLYTLVPLTNSVGLVADWCVMDGAPDFYQVTKTMHDSLQGAKTVWTDEMWAIWRNYNEITARGMDVSNYDYIVVHDPQPAGVLSYARDTQSSAGTRWFWRCHIDLTDASQEVWETLRPFVEQYEGLVFTLEDYVKDGLRGPEVFISPPGIDPLSPKNVKLDKKTRHKVLASAGIDPERPLIAQVSRFDPWKDPLGVIDVYRDVKQQVPGLQLAMVANVASDAPDGWVFYEKTLRHAGEDPDIHFLTDPMGLGNDVEVNAIQTMADVVIQKSIREGFGLVVTEALWKARPVVAGDAGGIRMQVLDGETGYLATSNQDYVDRVLELLGDQETACRMGEAGREHVRKNFLITRYLRDYLKMFNRFAR